MSGGVSVRNPSIQRGREAVYGIWVLGHGVDVQGRQRSEEQVGGVPWWTEAFGGVHNFRRPMHPGRIHR